MSMKSTSVPEHLHPDQPILDSEIQQITVEEFNRNIQTAESTILGLIELKLPRSLKRKIGECASDIQNSKKSMSLYHTSLHTITPPQPTLLFSAFEQTGEIPEDEGIQINQPQNVRPSSPTTSLAPTTSQKPAKRLKRAPPVNPASLLHTTAKPVATPDLPAPAPPDTGEDGFAGIPAPQEHSAAPPPPNSSSATVEPQPASTTEQTTFNQISQTISPGEVFKPTEPTPPSITQLNPAAGTGSQDAAPHEATGLFHPAPHF